MFFTLHSIYLPLLQMLIFHLRDVGLAFLSPCFPEVLPSSFLSHKLFDQCHQTALVFSLSRLWLIALQTAAYCVCPLPAVEIISNMYFRCDQHKSIYLFKAWDKGGGFHKKKLWLDYVILRCVLCRWQLCSSAESQTFL